MKPSRITTSAEGPSICQARRLLHAVCIFGPSPDQLGPIAQALNQPLDWQYLLERGARHKLLPLFNHVLKHAPPDLVNRVPAGARRVLMAAALDAEATCRKQTSLVKTLLEAFAQHSLPVMVVKGLTIAALYPQPSLRPSGDIDLIVHERDWPAVAAALRELRIEPFAVCAVVPHLSSDLVLARASYFSQGQVNYRAPCGTIIEVHFRLLNIGIPAAVEDAWDRVRIQPLGELAMPTVAREDAILFQALHMQGHHFCQFIWFSDLCVMLKTWGPHLDWSQVQRRAREWRIERTMDYVFELLQDLGGPVSPMEFASANRIQDFFYRRRWPKQRVLRLERNLPFGASIWLYLQQRATWPDRLRFTWRVLFPPRACLGSESRCSYLARFLGNAMPRLQKLLNLPDSLPPS